MERKAYGVCLGASTISAVELVADGSMPTLRRVITKPHEGNPRSELRRVLEELDPGSAPVLLTGRKFREFVSLPTVAEPEAAEAALRHVANGDRYDALVSAGGETFMVYHLTDTHHIHAISTGNKCASGTGEFFLQQIKRMDLSVEQAVEAARSGNPYAVSGRCSVFCKSDCTHALNKGEPVANVTAGLCHMIAGKVRDLLAATGPKRVMMVGGTALNTAVVDGVRSAVAELHVPPEAAYFEALGAGLLAFSKGTPANGNLFLPGKSSFTFLPPLREFEELVSFNTIRRDTVAPGDRCLLGLDVGSTTTKAVLIRETDQALLASAYLRTNGRPVEASRACFRAILEHTGAVSYHIGGLGVTGSGRHIAGLFSLTDGVVNEIIAHAAAAVHFDPEVDTIFEIGGQDAKYTHITRGVASDYAMNEACSAGTGSFLEESAYESLGVPVTEIADLAIQGIRPPNFSDQCAAFISSDIKNATHEGISREEILSGLVYSICMNYVNRVKGERPIGTKIFMQGGVCYNRAVPLAMAGLVKRPIVVPPEPGLMGAFGVALEVGKRIRQGLVREGHYDLEQIVTRHVEYGEPFTCRGGSEGCDLKCRIERISIDGKTYPFGGACNRYYTRGRPAVADPAKPSGRPRHPDLVQYIRDQAFRRFAPRALPQEGGPTIGISTSFLALRMFPLFSTFFAELGCPIVLPDGVEERAFRRQTTSLCYPAQISLGLFDSLLQKRPDRVFMPHVKEFYIPGGIDRREFCATCLLVAGEAYWLRQAFHGEVDLGQVISPTINFNGGWDRGRTPMEQVARDLGYTDGEGRRAYDAALQNQRAFEAALRARGEQALAELHDNPNAVAVVLFGRAYNAYAPEANKGIPRKLLNAGMRVIPYDLLPWQEEPLPEEHAEWMSWAAGQRILRAATVVARDPQLFGVYISNFLCAPDSFLVSYFRRIMGAKPSLTLELDAHTADAGINTRIEAFLDIVHNYRETQRAEPDGHRRADADWALTPPRPNTPAPVATPAPTAPAPFRIARIEGDGRRTVYTDSDGKRSNLRDSSVKMILPNMGDLATRAMAAACNRCGITTVAMPVADREALDLGRAATTGKECLPMHVCLGTLLKYLKYRPKEHEDERLMMLLPKGSGYCRLGQYHVYINQLIRERRLRNVALITPSAEENFLGLGPDWSINAWRALMVSDVMDDVRLALIALAKDRNTALQVFEEECERILYALEHEGARRFHRTLAEAADRLRRIPLKMPPENAPTVELTGEIFVRRDAFSSLDIADRLAEKGFVVTNAPIGEWMYYVNFLIRNGMVESRFSLAGRVDFFVSTTVQRHIERRIKRILSRSGLASGELIDIDSLLEHKYHVVPKLLTGEHDLVVAGMLKHSFDQLCGMVSVGPFGCMQLRFAEAVTVPLATYGDKKASFEAASVPIHSKGFEPADRFPFLNVECDGNPFPQLLEARFESFCLQAARVAERQGKDVSHISLS